MPAVSEMSKLKRDIEALSAALRPARPGQTLALSDKDRRAIRSEIDSCIRALDELRDRLAG
ncbi:hypothetical protein [Devosia sp.]|uniref:hypothetical protein n=1 Tax=Devosia sp. TaxID=1871048 RepID=UPI003A942271